MQINLSLLSAGSATGPATVLGFGGDYVFSVAGTFGGSTIGLEMLGPDGTTWIAIEDDAGPLALTSAAVFVASLPAGSYRATVTGGSGVSVTATLRSV